MSANDADPRPTVSGVDVAALAMATPRATAVFNDDRLGRSRSGLGRGSSVRLFFGSRSFDCFFRSLDAADTALGGLLPSVGKSSGSARYHDGGHGASFLQSAALRALLQASSVPPVNGKMP
jgi:hypothetical protein